MAEYVLEHWDQAIRQFEEGFKEEPQGAFLFNIAQAHRKAGLMIRQNLTAGSPYADVMIHGDGMTCLQYRIQQDGPTFQIISATWHPRRVELEREGDFVYFSVAGEDGKLRHAGGSFRIRLTSATL